MALDGFGSSDPCPTFDVEVRPGRSPNLTVLPLLGEPRKLDEPLAYPRVRLVRRWAPCSLGCVANSALSEVHT